MRYFLDTEFIESGPHRPIQLISIGLVPETGDRFLYMVSSEFNPDEANDWVKANVLPHIAGQTQYNLSEIRQSILEFIGDEKPEFWGYYADYDWVVFAQIFGKMIDLPKGWPMYCRDIKQLADEMGGVRLPAPFGHEHIAVDDAFWNRSAYQFLTRGK